MNPACIQIIIYIYTHTQVYDIICSIDISIGILNAVHAINSAGLYRKFKVFIAVTEIFTLHNSIFILYFVILGEKKVIK